MTSPAPGVARLTGVRAWLARRLCPEIYERAERYEALVDDALFRVSRIPCAVSAECARRHANGEWGWSCMRRFLPFAALQFAHQVEIEMAGRAALQGDDHER